MWKLFLLFAIAFWNIAVAHDDSVREAYYQGLLAPQSITPTFDKGYLIVYDFDSIEVYRPDGWPMYKVAAHVPNATFASINNAAVDTDGTLAGVVEYSGARSWAGGIASFDRAGTQTQFVDTGRYLPTQICFDADHSIWVLGWQEKQKLDERQEYSVLQHYSQDGQKLGEFLPRSSFEFIEFETEPAFTHVGLWGLRMANNRLGAFLGPGRAWWIELDLKGKVIGRWEIVGDRRPVAFTASGALYAHEGHGVSRFDRAAGTWKPMTGLPDGILLGADGDSLVFWMRSTNLLRWVPRP